MEIDLKKSKGASLSQRQYDTIMDYLTTGIKPPMEVLKSVDLYGNLNGGKVSKSCKGYYRFKSIVTRLKVRQSDGALLFKGSGKIVLPNSKFSAVIKEAHMSPGKKHLNMTATIAKLSEKYTIGCRQFGISEEAVRVVVKSCREGSCAEKQLNSKGYSMMKNLVKIDKADTDDKKQAGYTTPPKKYATSGSNSASIDFKSATTCSNSTTSGSDATSGSNSATMGSGSAAASSSSKSDIKAEITEQTKVPKELPRQDPAFAILEKLPTGNFIIKQFLMKTPCQSGAKSASRSEGNTPVKLSDVAGTSNMLPGFPLPSLGNNVVVMQCPVGTTPNMAGPYNPSQFTRPMSLTSLSSAFKSTQFSIPVNFIMSNPRPPNMHDKTGLAKNFTPYTLFPSSITNATNVTAQLFENPGTLRIEQKEDVSMDDNNNVDVTNDTNEAMDTSVNESTVGDDLNDSLSTSFEQGLPVYAGVNAQTGRMEIPYPFIWNNLSDMEAEEDPFTRINMAIKDMKPDVFKSLWGNRKAMETLKTKIDAVAQMVKAKKKDTENY